MSAGDQRFTRLGVEILGARIPRAQVTRLRGELVSATPQATTHLTAEHAEVLGARFLATQFTRLRGELLSGTRQARMYATSVHMDVLGANPSAGFKYALWTRLRGELVSAAHRARLHATSLHLEVAGEGLPIRPQQLFTRQVVEVAGSHPARVQLTRLVLEVLYDAMGVLLSPHTLPDVLANIFCHNWDSKAKLESAYSTAISSSSETLAEERRGLLDRPYRTLQVRFMGFDKHEVNRLSMTAMRLAQQRFTPIPLFTDFSAVKAVSSGTTIYCDTRFRRFFLGCRVMIHSWDSNRKPANVEYGLVQALADDQITLQAPLAGTFPVKSRVYPCIEAELSLAPADLNLVTDEVLDMSLTVKEATGSSALPATVTGFAAPPGFPTWNGRPVFDVPSDWSANIHTSIFREGEQNQVGRSENVSPDGPRAQFVHEMRLTLLSREKAWKVLQFFDSRMGRLRSFYMVDPATKFQANTVLTTGVRIKPVGNIEDLQAFMTHVAVVLRDGTIYIRDVASVTVDGAEWVIAFGSTIPAVSPTAVRKVTQAYHVRLRDDAMAEEWMTDEICSISLFGVEVLDDSDQELTNLAYTPTGPAPQQVPDLYLWTSAKRNAYQDAGRVAESVAGEPGVDGSTVVLWDDLRVSPSTVNLLQSGGTPPVVYINADGEVNGGRQTLRWTAGAKFLLRPLGDLFYDNAAGKGLTVFLALRVRDVAGVWNYFLKKTGVLEWSPTQCKLFEVLDVDVANNDVSHSNLLSDRLSRTVVVMLRWDPGVSAKVYRDGELMGTAVTPVTDLPPEATRELDVLDMGSELDGNDVLIYRRALTSAELNKVGRYLAATYSSPWTDIP